MKLKNKLKQTFQLCICTSRYTYSQTHLLLSNKLQRISSTNHPLKLFTHPLKHAFTQYLFYRRIDPTRIIQPIMQQDGQKDEGIDRGNRRSAKRGWSKKQVLSPSEQYDGGCGCNGYDGGLDGAGTVSVLTSTVSWIHSREIPWVVWKCRTVGRRCALARRSSASLHPVGAFRSRRRRRAG